MSQPVFLTDGKTCECMITEKPSAQNFMKMGVRYSPKRCGKPATIKVLGKTKEEKKMPPMYVCEECYLHFNQDNPGYKWERIGGNK